MSLPSSQKSLGVQQPRQIRFVSSDGQPQTKRRRVIAACRTCRKRKIRCSGEQPECKTCTDYGHKCLGYNEPGNPTTAATPRSTAQKDEKASQNKDTKGIRSPEQAKSSVVVGLGESHASAPDTPVTTAAQPRIEGDIQNPLQKGTKSVPDHVSISSPESTRSALISSHRLHVPYFRYFGPTAIVPGFKQMVVRVREPRKSNPSLSNDSTTSVRNQNAGGVSQALDETESSHSIHFYDPEDSLPNSELVTHLCEVFFTHLGCNFPFLQRERFLRDLSDKCVEPILVDAVCALAARFSLHPLLLTESDNGINYPHHGDAFAHRAMCAVVDSLSCPTPAVAQACLLLAYEEFGSNHDSGLWMYLGISIRMAQDLGIQKLEGMKYDYGRVGLAPNHIHSGRSATTIASRAEQEGSHTPLHRKDGQNTELDNFERAKERERVDSFWSIFFLDRVISSGTGRPVTLRDDDIEIHFPLESESIVDNGWPSPYPPLMRIIHLYGRVTDLLNSIKDASTVTTDTLKRLAGMESDLTGIYQKLSLKLHFNAVNFQNYVKFGHGTNFILLHFWFHTLIVLLHQPTLLHSFSGKIQQLFHNSRELSMSSAKTIADILAFAELIDAKSFIGNPFTSQPIYIAACAFLMESAYYSLPSSRAESPPLLPDHEPKIPIHTADTTEPSERNTNAKHSLLAAAAKDNYQRCYKALKALETYWAGTKYILTVLDQKAKGIWDPLLYTEEEMDSAVESPAVVPPLVSLGWKQTQAQEGALDQASRENPTSHPKASQGTGVADQPSAAGPSKIDPSQAIGWALTGATNSSQPNISFLYQLPTADGQAAVNPTAPHSHYGSGDSTPYHHTAPSQAVHPYPHQTAPYRSPDSLHVPPTQNPLPPNYSGIPPEELSPATTRYGLSRSPVFSPNPPPTTASRQNPQSQDIPLNVNSSASYPYGAVPVQGSIDDPRGAVPNNPAGYGGEVGNNMHRPVIQSQEVDMNTLHNQNSLPFSFDGEFMPWLEYLPEDVLNYFGEHQA